MKLEKTILTFTRYAQTYWSKNLRESNNSQNLEITNKKEKSNNSQNLKMSIFAIWKMFG